METALIAALVAAIVALIGSLVTLKVSRESRASQIEARVLDALLKNREVTRHKFDTFLSVAERLRLKLSQLSKSLNAEIEPKNTKHIYVNIEGISELYEQLITEWSNIAPDMESPDSFSIAVGMHEINNMGHVFREQLSKYASAHESGSLDDILKQIEELTSFKSAIDWMAQETYNLYLSVMLEKQRVVIEHLKNVPNK